MMEIGVDKDKEKVSKNKLLFLRLKLNFCIFG